MRRLVVVGLGLVALVVLIHLHTYPFGLVLDLPFGHWCGVEFAPTAGPFCDVS